MLKLTLMASLFFLVGSIEAQEAPFKGESEASAVVVNGNSTTETYGAKTTNTWQFTEFNSGRVFGSYLKSKGSVTNTGTGVTSVEETARAWTAGVRYERAFIQNVFSGFLQQLIESDPYNGVFQQRNSTDLGAKYYVTKTNGLAWFVEAGLRNSSTYTGISGTDPFYNTNLARGYSEFTQQINAGVSTRVWIEYLGDMKENKKSQWNAEASFNVMMSSLLSLKTGYLLNHNEGANAPSKKDTTTWTTALVAKY